MKVQRQIDRLLAQRAAEWIEVLKTGDESERTAFAAWLRQSKLHVEHYLELVAIDQEMKALDPAQCPDVDELLRQAAPNVVPIGSGAGTRQKSRPASAARNWWLGAAAAASVAALTFALWPSHKVSTAIGEQRTLTLPDGSVITLNTLTTLRYDFSERERNVSLDAGEAVFKVAQEASRPFVVHTRTAAVRAVGTQFNVYQRPKDTVVSVIEGRVQITTKSPNAENAEPVVQNLAAGEEAQVALNGRIEKRAKADVQKALAWRERRLSFDEAPLAEMVREFNRYSGSVRLRLDGEAAEQYRYGGVFDADDPESLAALLSRESDLIVERRDGEIVIRVR